MKAAVLEMFRYIFIFAVISQAIAEDSDAIDWSEVTIGQAEADCRFTMGQQMENGQWVFYLLGGSICGFSLLFLLASIGVFVYIQRNVSFLLHLTWILN